MRITRRNLLAAALVLSKRSGPATQMRRLTIDTRRKAGVTPIDFLGLGYEISSVSTPGLLSSQNLLYTQLIRTLGPSGNIRVGGITADYATFLPNAEPVASPKGSVVNLSSLRDLASMLQATGWTLIWCLNLGTGNVEQAVTEAQAVTAAVKDNLLAFEIGNEPDLFNRGSSAHRPAAYSYADYLNEYRRYKAAIRGKLPNAPFAAPDAATTTDWVTRFAADEGTDLKLLTHHYYRECANPGSTLDKLLNPDPKLAPLLQKLNAATAADHVPYRICETNSFCGGGKPGVSDTFGAALWTLEFLWELASAGCAGVNMETGVNQLGFISSYSPIADNSAKPEYYGMLAFARGARGQRLLLDSANLPVYAAMHDRGVTVTIINKDAAPDAEVNITTNHRFRSIHAFRLTAPSLESKEGVTFAGSSVTPGGEWKPNSTETLPAKGGDCVVHVPAASAIVVTFSG